MKNFTNFLAVAHVLQRKQFTLKIHPDNGSNLQDFLVLAAIVLNLTESQVNTLQDNFGLHDLTDVIFPNTRRGIEIDKFLGNQSSNQFDKMHGIARSLRVQKLHKLAGYFSLAAQH